MARINTPTIPPSLVAAYNRVLRTVWRIDMPTYQSALAQTARYPSPTDTRPTTLIRARIAAEWIADEHIPATIGRGRADFITARAAEIISGSYPATYWAPLTAAANETRLAYPACILDIDGVAPGYADPNRRASWCTYDHYDHSYTTPTPPADLPDPSPGWSGEVQLTQWLDIWLAQQRVKFSSSTDIGSAAAQPIWAQITMTHDLTASTRGNRMWASANIAPAFFSGDHDYSDYRRDISPNIGPQFVYALQINGPASPWAQTITRTLQLDCRHATPWDVAATTTNLQFDITPTPPFGRYFARNDWARCVFNAAVTAYRAIGP